MLLLIGVSLGVMGIEFYEFMILRATKSVRIVNQVVAIKPLEKYTIENLGKRSYQSKIVLDEITASNAAFLVQKFHFDSDGKNVSGLIHLPVGPLACDRCPVIVQFRGYTPVENYENGYGTKHSAEMFATNGFISVAPDFLGYGDSASTSADVFEARFETYTTALNLLSAIDNWSFASPNMVGLWGHSNGGQIALTTLEISEKKYPTVLWAPVSAPFPYSILYFMNDNEEGDRNLRKKLVAFEEVYDLKYFDPINFLQNIQASIQLHQGAADASVPVEWSRNLIMRLIKLDKQIKYFEYPGADHNLVPDWNRVVERDIVFFNQLMAK